MNVGGGGVSHVMSNLFIDEFLQKEVCISRARFGDSNVCEIGHNMIANIKIEFSGERVNLMLD